ncbi:hypothetical protein CLOM_g14880 [Closterium sp. NIES-68]|nr:hypothetical protein CLOM_g14880 [Closterium sp. NIES-68]GJP75560.1 hypothetical protein CLOP_g5992 [Closterium sp. NIES-67]
MRTLPLLSGLILLSALLLAASAEADVAPDGGAQALVSRRFLTDDHHHDHDDDHKDDHKDEPSCIEKYKTQYAKCDKSEKKCDDHAEDDDEREECEKKSKTCEMKAYRSFKACKYGDWGCKDWCKYYKKQCYAKNRSSCDEKYEDCKDDCN